MRSLDHLQLLFCERVISVDVVAEDLCLQVKQLLGLLIFFIGQVGRLIAIKCYTAFDVIIVSEAKVPGRETRLDLKKL